jgi:hypothetical protein
MHSGHRDSKYWSAKAKEARAQASEMRGSESEAVLRLISRSYDRLAELEARRETAALRQSDSK